MSISQSTAPEAIGPTATRLLFCEPGGELCGIYFLCQGDVVVYVGKSLNAAERIGCHCQDKKYDRVWFLPVPRRKLHSEEMKWIRKLKPKYNIVGIGSEAVEQAKEWRRFKMDVKLGLATPEQIKKHWKWYVKTKTARDIRKGAFANNRKNRASV